MDLVPPVGSADFNDWATGNEQTGAEGVSVPHEALTHPQAEIVNAIIAAGLEPDPEDLTQLQQAIITLIAADRQSGTPCGGVIAWTSSTPPEDYVECNGSAINRTTYADLFAVIGTGFGAGDGSTTFNLPDLRGEFIRGWDNSRGVDGGRVLGSSQADDYKSHSHTLTASSTAEGTASDIDRSDGTGSLTSQPRSISTNASGGSETRPRNIAMMFCIKY
ncbi:MAG: phage tail protein [Candidatus Sedimenticola sp. (ex Thyasira tokunagai)]